jgi:ribosomal protein S18 acetylase RimI-like enzyme
MAGTRYRHGDRARADRSARELESSLVLQVFASNPRAARLYESLGFIRTEESGTDVSMRLEPKL